MQKKISDTVSIIRIKKGNKIFIVKKSIRGNKNRGYSCVKAGYTNIQAGGKPPKGSANVARGGRGQITAPFGACDVVQQVNSSYDLHRHEVGYRREQTEEKKGGNKGGKRR